MAQKMTIIKTNSVSSPSQPLESQPQPRIYKKRPLFLRNSSHKPIKFHTPINMNKSIYFSNRNNTYQNIHKNGADSLKNNIIQQINENIEKEKEKVEVETSEDKNSNPQSKEVENKQNKANKEKTNNSQISVENNQNDNIDRIKEIKKISDLIKELYNKTNKTDETKRQFREHFLNIVNRILDDTLVDYALLEKSLVWNRGAEKPVADQNTRNSRFKLVRPCSVTPKAEEKKIETNYLRLKNAYEDLENSYKQIKSELESKIHDYNKLEHYCDKKFARHAQCFYELNSANVDLAKKVRELFVRIEILHTEKLIIAHEQNKYRALLEKKENDINICNHRIREITRGLQSFRDSNCLIFDLNKFLKNEEESTNKYSPESTEGMEISEIPIEIVQEIIPENEIPINTDQDFIIENEVTIPNDQVLHIESEIPIENDIIISTNHDKTEMQEQHNSMEHDIIIISP